MLGIGPPGICPGTGATSVGVLLVSWRYLWSTTPLHRSTVVGMHMSGRAHSTNVSSTREASPLPVARARCRTACSR
ncbi:MAG: hypothetical protein J2P19_21415 [Pseudonocardia sp.]|nr:hypothetical protein [Pseudonocardia sp.]